MKSKRTFTLCAHCHEPILDRPRQAEWHGPNHPECYVAHNVYLRDQERKCREHQKDERKKPANSASSQANKIRQPFRWCKQACPKCKNRILTDGNRYACHDFYSRQKGIFDGDYIYATYSTAQEDDQVLNGVER